MEEDSRANSHTNMMIARLQRKLEDAKDPAERAALQKELDALRASLMKG
jgi:hypothetical protein